MPTITFVLADGTRREIKAEKGLSLLEVAHKSDLGLEGACEGSLACATCHVIILPEWFGKLEPASEDEEDMLDMAFGLTATSRLGCQVIVTDELDGLVVTIPDATRNMNVDKK